MKPQLSIEAFADWCEKQPADKAYSYSNCGGHCAFGQYLEWLGLPVDFVAMDVWLDTRGERRPLPVWVDEMVIGAGYSDRASHTFGSLAARLRAKQ